MKNNQKLLYGLIVLLAAGAVALIVMIFTNIKSPVASGAKELKTVKLTEMSESLVDGMEASGGVSESFFSTKLDQNALNKPLLFTTYQDFRKYINEYWDIHVTYPQGAGDSFGGYKFDAGYVAVIIVAEELQSTDKEVRVSAVYRDDSKIVYELSQYELNKTYGFNVDLPKDCKGVYTIVYITPEDAANIENCTFAINKTVCLRGDDGC